MVSLEYEKGHKSAILVIKIVFFGYYKFIFSCIYYHWKSFVGLCYHIFCVDKVLHTYFFFSTPLCTETERLILQAC